MTSSKTSPLTATPGPFPTGDALISHILAANDRLEELAEPGGGKIANLQRCIVILADALAAVPYAAGFSEEDLLEWAAVQLPMFDDPLIEKIRHKLRCIADCDDYLHGGQVTLASEWTCLYFAAEAGATVKAIQHSVAARKDGAA